MDNIMKLLKTKAAKIAVAACAAMATIVVLLTAVFFLRTGAGEIPSAEVTTAISAQEQPVRLGQPELESILSAEPTATELVQTTHAESTAAISTAMSATHVPSAAQQSTTTKTIASIITQTTTTPHIQTTATTKSLASAAATQSFAATTTAPVPISQTCTISISCKTLLPRLDQLKQGTAEMVPSDGVVLSTRTAVFLPGESVFDVLKRTTYGAKVHIDFSEVPAYGGAYIKGIGNIYELDCGQLSGWMYKVNGAFPNYGCSSYQLRQGDVVEFLYTCDLGRDIGGGGVTGQKG